MGVEFNGAGETLTAIVVSNELSQDSGHGDKDGNHVGAQCNNCGTILTGKYCHACGQSGHMHRSLLHMFEELLHGLFHFDTKVWRTLPALILRPAKLTREYIEGKRMSYVSPLALFLFLIFLMFFVFSLTEKELNKAFLNSPETREEIVKEMAATTEALKEQRVEQATLVEKQEPNIESLNKIRESTEELRLLQEKLDKLDGKPKTIEQYQNELQEAEKTLADLQVKKSKLEASAATVPSGHRQSILTIKQWINFAESDIKYFKRKIAKLEKSQETKAEKEQPQTDITNAVKPVVRTEANSRPASSVVIAHNSADNTTGDTEIEDLSQIPVIGNMLAHADKNRELTIYKMKKNASSYAFLLMPISLPFLWLLFIFRKKYVMFDHAVFSLYSLSFMCILLMVIAVLRRFNFDGVAGLLFFFAPPIHMFSQLRGAYSLSFFAAFWRTIVLLVVALISLLSYAMLVTVLSA